jgi:signal transduction histidine kinase
VSEDYELLGRPPRGELVALAGLATQVCDAPSAAIYLLTTDGRQRVAAVGDELEDPGFEVSGRLTSPQGDLIGSLCVFDHGPRELSAEQTDGLQRLADRAVDVLELDLRTKQLERMVGELAAARDEARSCQDRLEAFAGQVGHDLRNPLTSVSMSLEMLQEQPSVIEDDEALWMVDRALGGARRMDVLIGGLVESARSADRAD